MKYWVTFFIATILSANLSLTAQTTNHEIIKNRKELMYGAKRHGRRTDEAMNRFRSHRLGAFVHWGLYAIPGGFWNGKPYAGAAEWLQQWAKVPTSEWMKLQDEWSPSKFNAEEWAAMFKKMGVKYVKITTKHHEGFCLWPSKYSQYTVAHTPDQRDVLGELVKALDREGIDVHFYFSVMDWSHPDYRSTLKTHADSVAFDRFLQFTENQLQELCQNYPQVKDFWFDGTWDSSIKSHGKWSSQMEDKLKQWIPGVTVNSRLRADEYGSRHFDSNGDLMGDYESGYERRLPDPITDLKVTQWDWEACMTVPENQWGYHRDWSLSYVKTPIEVLQRIVHAVSMGGNMVVNFGPTGQGDFRPEERALARYIGRWMRVNGEAIYGCDYAGLAKQDWGFYTRKEDNIYMIVFNQPFSGQLTVKVPKGMQIVSGSILDSGKQVKVTLTTSNEYNISAPHSKKKTPYVIRLQVKNGKGNQQFKEALT